MGTRREASLSYQLWENRGTKIDPHLLNISWNQFTVCMIIYNEKVDFTEFPQFAFLMSIYKNSVKSLQMMQQFLKNIVKTEYNLWIFYVHL